MKTPDPKSTPVPPKEDDGKVRQVGGRAVWQWAADTARMVALSSSQILRKLDNSSLSIDDDAAGRGQPSPRQGGKMPGGGVNPYESRPTPRPPPRSRETHRTASPTVARGQRSAAKPRSPAPTRARASWWSRLFRRG